MSSTILQRSAGRGDLPSAGRPASPRGFSLLEVIGVLAILSILAAALAPALLRELERKAKEDEVGRLRSLVGGLQNYVLSARQIPASNTLAQAIAPQIGWMLSDVQNNRRDNARFFVVDPALQVGVVNGKLPYVQGSGGSIQPVKLRIMILSSLGAPLSDSIKYGAALSAPTFQMIWSSADGLPPTGWPGGENWDDIKIARLDLSAMFVRVILNNNPSDPLLLTSSNTGKYSVNNTNSPVYLPSVPFSSYYLLGTTLGLHSSTDTLQVLMVVQDVALVNNQTNQLANQAPNYACPSFVYEKGIWRGRLFMSTDAQKHNGQDLQAAYEIFMSGPANVYKVGSVTQTTQIRKMWEYMSNYVVWASSGFPSGLKGVVSASQSAMASEISTYCNKKAHVQ